MSGGAMRKTHERLVQTGMPASVDGCAALGKPCSRQGWHRYWGTTGPVTLDFGLAQGAPGFKETTRVEGEFEIVESESGARTRQVLENDVTYSMPEFIEYPVRDRASWAFYKERTAPARVLAVAEVEDRCRALDQRTRPLVIGAGGAYSVVRSLMGPHRASLMFYDDPELVHDIIAWQTGRFRRFTAPLIARLRPEVVQMGEDLCYNHGMLISPRQFHEFCAAHYREVCACARANGATLVAVDTDGNAMEYVGIARGYGVNAVFPFEVKAGNDLFRIRGQFPDFVCFGWLEKECVNEGNERLIRDEITCKVPPLLEAGRYFPNGDHGLQPLVTFDNMCRFMTLLHEVTGNPEGEFPRKAV
ncbi:MAG: uroporphyrinogen decarboxylase family protein [Phycisphaerae bacterium]|nr:uroporphyrinogen decarboxylase family protein [Phycisphaerae bacterium]